MWFNVDIIKLFQIISKEYPDIMNKLPVPYLYDIHRMLYFHSGFNYKIKLNEYDVKKKEADLNLTIYDNEVIYKAHIHIYFDTKITVEDTFFYRNAEIEEWMIPTHLGREYSCR